MVLSCLLLLRGAIRAVRESFWEFKKNCQARHSCGFSHSHYREVIELANSSSWVQFLAACSRWNFEEDEEKFWSWELWPLLCNTNINASTSRRDPMFLFFASHLCSHYLILSCSLTKFHETVFYVLFYSKCFYQEMGQMQWDASFP